MSRVGDLFSIETDPDVIAARAEWQRCFDLNRTAKPGVKMKRMAALQIATTALLRAEALATARLNQTKRTGL